MKVISASTKKTNRQGIPPLPRPLRMGARDALTVKKARQIIRAHGGSPVTAAEKQQLVAAGLWGLPEE